MTAEELVTTMRAALASERQAIRRLDVDAVTEAAATKERILGAVSNAPASEADAYVSTIMDILARLSGVPRAVIDTIDPEDVGTILNQLAGHIERYSKKS